MESMSFGVSGYAFAIHPFAKVLSAVKRESAPGDFWYLASPYTKYPDGHEAAFEDISKVAAGFLMEGVTVFAPISHSHPIAKSIPSRFHTHRFWLDHDHPMMKFARGAIICCMPSWRTSTGVTEEIETFERRGKPVFYMAFEGAR